MYLSYVSINDPVSQPHPVPLFCFRRLQAAFALLSLSYMSGKGGLRMRRGVDISLGTFAGHLEPFWPLPEGSSGSIEDRTGPSMTRWEPVVSSRSLSFSSSVSGFSWRALPSSSIDHSVLCELVDPLYLYTHKQSLIDMFVIKDCRILVRWSGSNASPSQAPGLPVTQLVRMAGLG